jgi:hypothetical protein
LITKGAEEWFCVSENVGWCRAWHGTLFFSTVSRHGSAAACRQLAVKKSFVINLAGKLAREPSPAQPTLGSTEGAYLLRYVLRIRECSLAYYGCCCCCCFFCNFRTFILAANLNFRTSELCLAAGGWGGRGELGSAMEPAFLHYNWRA